MTTCVCATARAGSNGPFCGRNGPSPASSSAGARWAPCGDVARRRCFVGPALALELGAGEGGGGAALAESNTSCLSFSFSRRSRSASSFHRCKAAGPLLLAWLCASSSADPLAVAVAVLAADAASSSAKLTRVARDAVTDRRSWRSAACCLSRYPPMKLSSTVDASGTTWALRGLGPAATGLARCWCSRWSCPLGDSARKAAAKDDVVGGHGGGNGRRPGC